MCRAATASPAVATIAASRAAIPVAIAIATVTVAIVTVAVATTDATRATSVALQGALSGVVHDQAARLWRSQLLHHGLVLSTQE